MTLLAAAMSLLYFIAVGVAFLNDRRTGRDTELYAGLSDDEMSPLGDDRDPIGAGDRIEPPAPVAAAAPVADPLPLERRFDDMT
jgi:sec-independent protein translocase protein TatC